jgi:hypothetical protein
VEAHLPPALSAQRSMSAVGASDSADTSLASAVRGKQSLSHLPKFARSPHLLVSYKSDQCSQRMDKVPTMPWTEVDAYDFAFRDHL